MVNNISKARYTIQSVVENGLLNISMELASKCPNALPLQEALKGLRNIKEERDLSILGVLPYSVIPPTNQERNR